MSPSSPCITSQLPFQRAYSDRRPSLKANEGMLADVTMPVALSDQGRPPAAANSCFRKRVRCTEALMQRGPTGRLSLEALARAAHEQTGAGPLDIVCCR